MWKVVLGASNAVLVGAIGFVWWYLQSRTVPKVDEIQFGQSEIVTLAQERRQENDYLRAALKDCREELDDERGRGR